MSQSLISILNHPEFPNSRIPEFPDFRAAEKFENNDNKNFEYFTGKLERSKVVKIGPSVQ